MLSFIFYKSELIVIFMHLIKLIINDCISIYELKFTINVNEKISNNRFNLTIPVVMVCAVASLHCTNHAKPCGPELQVKRMLG